MKKLLIVCLMIMQMQLFSQESYNIIRGNKATYTLEIPNSFKESKYTGSNVDHKFTNDVGCTITTIVKNLPPQLNDDQINILTSEPDNMFKEDLESDGLENVIIIKRGLKSINGKQSYYAYYNCNIGGNRLYQHTITQFKNKKLITLSVSCPEKDKSIYMASINRIANSLK